ncbi:MAG: aspartate aminotransferase family protein [Chloroflexi bacterium]|nr:aspartate aminotransferase family protein [Chloroflexota bacterium]
MATVEQASLRELDAMHVIHPLHQPSIYQQGGPIVLERGEGALLWDVEGRQYIDGLAGLWNVVVGHGRRELAEAAAQQMSTLAYCSSYSGQSNVPAIRLAAKLAEISYPRLKTTFFASGGAESNESAFKLARFYWKRRGRPEKVKIISRYHGYHGVTIAAMSATGIPPYWEAFDPRAPGFLHIEAPYPFRSSLPHDHPSYPHHFAQALEDAILREGPDTIAAFIAEPVQGAGGVIVPPYHYFPRVREICDRYDVLLIADEVITGFGRTGRRFALQHWGVQPDIMSFAKAITSGYFPLGGIMISEAIADVLRALPADSPWMHAFTYSAHATGCAVALRNLQIIEEEHLIARAEELGHCLLDDLQRLTASPLIGEVRGLGLMAAVELGEKGTRKLFPAEHGLGGKVVKGALRRGLITRNRGDVILIAPPFVTTKEQLHRIVSILEESIAEAGQSAGLAG